VLVRLYDARERILSIIYQTTGIADILRGETTPEETLGAQQLKSRFATRRISKSQKDVARFARDLLRLRGAVMAKHYSPATLERMSGLPEPLPPLPPPPPMLIPAPPPSRSALQDLRALRLVRCQPAPRDRRRRRRCRLRDRVLPCRLRDRDLPYHRHCRPAPAWRATVITTSRIHAAPANI
jgi:hypothetical protein